MKRILSLLPLVAALFLLQHAAPARAQQQLIYCNASNSAVCNTSANPGTGFSGDPAWLSFGKTNANFTQLYGMFGASSNLKTSGSASASDIVGLFTGIPSSSLCLGSQGLLVACSGAPATPYYGLQFNNAGILGSLLPGSTGIWCLDWTNLSAAPTLTGCAGSGGSVTQFSFTNGNGLNGTVTNATTTPALSLAPAFTGMVYSNGTGFVTATSGDFPTLNQSTTGNAATATALAATPSLCSGGQAAQGVLANGNATGCFTPSGGGVSSFSGDGTLLSNSASTGAVTATLANTGVGYGVWGNIGSSSAAPSYHALSTYPTAAFPTLNQSTTGNAATATALSTTGSNGTFWGVSGGIQGYYTPAGGGNMSTSGSPAQYETGVFASSTTMLGVGPGTSGQAYVSGGASAYPSFSSTLSDVTSVNGTTIPASQTLVYAGGPGGTPSSLTLTNATGLPNASVIGLGTFATQNYASPPAIGGTTPAAGAFTTLSASSGTFTAVAGGVTIGSPTGGAEGAGTLNMAGCYVNGVACGTGGSTAFSSLTSGSNTTATMTVGTGASLAYTGSGVLNANEIAGYAWPTLVASDCLTNNGSTLSWGTCGGSGGVTTTGSPANTYLAGFSGASSITGTANATLSGGALTLGVSGTAGTVAFGNATSGTVTLGTVTGALGSVTASLPANTGTLAETNYAQTFTGLQKFTNADMALLGTSTGYTLLESGLTSTSNNTLTLPSTATDTLAGIGTAQTWTAAQTFTNADLLLKGSTSGSMTLEAPAIASTYVTTFPANTGTVADLNFAQTWSAVQTFGTDISIGGVTPAGATGTGNLVFATSPTFVTPNLGTPASGTLTNATGLPIATGVSGLGTGVATALAVNVGSAGAPVVNGGALGTPSSGTATNLTGTASALNIGGTAANLSGTPALPNGTTATTQTTGDNTTKLATDAFVLANATSGGITALTGDVTASGPGSAAATVVKIEGGAVPASAALLGTNSSSQPTAVTVTGCLSVSGGVLSAPSQINAQTGTTYTVLSTDACKLLTLSNTSAVAVTLPQATGSFAAGFSFDVQNLNTGTVTITPTTSTINGASTLTLAQNTGCTVTSDGTNYQVSACTAIASGGGSGTVNSGTASHLSYYASTGTAVSSAGNATISNGTLSLGAAGTLGAVTMGNATSGTLTLEPVTGALGTVTVSIPAATDTLVNLTSTQTLTNKTLTSPTLTTPALGTPASGVMTNLTGTPSSIGLTNATANSLPLTGIATIANNTILGNTSGSTGSVTAQTTVTYLIDAGTKFTIASGTGTCATTSTTVGGTAAGEFECTGTSGASTAVITLPTAPNGWSCNSNDITTTADTVHQTAFSTTSATLSGTIVASDHIIFNCMGF